MSDPNTPPTDPPPMPPRAETGPMRFGPDWPGVFIRGKHAFHYAAHLERLIEFAQHDPDGAAVKISTAVIRGLLSDLRSCIVENGGMADQRPLEELHPIEECRR